MRFPRIACRMVVVIGLVVISTAAIGLDDLTWMRTYMGGYGHSIYETDDGGGIIAGTFGAGMNECCKPWLIRLNADGSVRWHKIYEAPLLSGANNMVPTRDGGYVLAVESTEFMVLKVDSEGNILWAREYGDGGLHHLRVLESNEGNLLVTGTTKLFDDGFHPNGRALLLDPDGNVIWQKVYGRPLQTDYFAGATLAYNGNFIVAGSSRGDYWVMELDQEGNIVWQNIYGGALEDTGLVVAKVLDRYYLVVGASDTYQAGTYRDWWALLLSRTGKVWKQFSLGGHDAEDPHTAIGTSDGGFMIGGGTGSFGSGFSDIWLVKFDSRARIEWQKTYGLPMRTDHAWQVLETETGYAVVGDSYYFPIEYEIWLITMDRDGNVEYGECGTVGDSDAKLTRTRTDVTDAGALTWDSDIRPSDLKVGVTHYPWSVEACSPFPPTD